MRWPWQKKEPTPKHLQAGLWGEKQAVDALRKKGYRILGTRVRVGKHDELDIVARHKNVLVFVEVKTRQSEEFGRPISSVTPAKRRSLSRAAMHYLQKIRKKPDYFRFDVVEVIGSEGEGHPEIRIIENAFPLGNRYRIPW